MRVADTRVTEGGIPRSSAAIAAAAARIVTPGTLGAAATEVAATAAAEVAEINSSAQSSLTQDARLLAPTAIEEVEHEGEMCRAARRRPSLREQHGELITVAGSVEPA